MSENLFNKKISNIKGQLTFKDTNLSIESGIKIPTDEVVIAKKGSLYLCKTDGNVYKKLTDDVDLNWEEVGAGGSGSGDLKSDGSVPMDGNLNLADNDILNVDRIRGNYLTESATATASIPSGLNTVYTITAYFDLNDFALNEVRINDVVYEYNSYSSTGNPDEWTLEVVDCDVDFSSITQFDLISNNSERIRFYGEEMDFNGAVLTEVGEPVNSYDATTKQYVDNSMSNYLQLAGGTMTGNIDMNDQNIVNVPLVESVPEGNLLLKSNRGAVEVAAIDESMFQQKYYSFYADAGAQEIASKVFDNAIGYESGLAVGLTNSIIKTTDGTDETAITVNKDGVQIVSGTTTNVNSSTINASVGSLQLRNSTPDTSNSLADITMSGSGLFIIKNTPTAQAEIALQSNGDLGVNSTSKVTVGADNGTGDGSYISIEPTTVVIRTETPATTQVESSLDVNDVSVTMAIVGPTASATITAGANGLIDITSNGRLFIGSSSIEMDGQNITTMADPINLQDAATKNYVDTKILIATNLTSTQRDALTAVSGMMIFNTTTTKLQVYDGSTWIDLH